MLRILIADDHEVVRRGIKEILIEGLSFVELGEANDTSSLVMKALDESWDIIISDLSMPGGGGIDAVGRIRERKPNQKILIISIYPEEQYAIRVMRAGASGFLNKDIAPDELIKAVQSILDGKKYIQPSLAEKMTQVLGRQHPVSPHEMLSDREMEVMVKLASGYSVSDIARQLSLTPNTISTYRTRILNKLDLSNNAGIIQYAMEHQLI
jgi:Response regulator containing a CheY-like receiver domain and an HTH DNA-binding domain